MKIRIAQSLQAEVEESRKALVREHSKLVGSIRGLAKLEQRAEELPGEIESLENGDASDKSVRAALRDKRDELAMIERQIEGLNHEAKTMGSPEQSRASSKMQDARIAIERALTPAMQARLAEAIKMVRPLFNNEAAARAVAIQSPFYVQFCHYCVRPFTSGINPSNLKQIIALAEEVLAGELKFEFTPDI